MSDFCTFLIGDPAYQELMNSVPTPSSWSARLIPDPSERFWFNGRSRYVIEHLSALDNKPTDFAPGHLLVVSSSAAVDGRNAVSLLQACCDIVDPNYNQMVYGTPAFVLSAKESYKPILQSRGFFEKFAYCDHLPVALEMASNLWPDRSGVYATHKLMLSYRLSRSTWWSMHPDHGQVFEKYPHEHMDHVSTAFAINAAFSAIEELHLEVRSSNKNRRWGDGNGDGDGVSAIWNPKVLENIEGRLRDSGIDLTQQVEWIQRGAASEAEQDLKPQFMTPSPYAKGQEVRDLQLSLPNALHYCSYLRNFMTAHRFREATSTIGPYEVFNVQSVARRLILSKAKCWNLALDSLGKRHNVAIKPSVEPGQGSTAT